MGIIYCIYKNGRGYTGQALRYNASGVGRIIEHINYERSRGIPYKVGDTDGNS